VGSKAEILGSGANTPHDTSCKFDLKTKFDPQGYSQTPSWVEISLEEIDSGAPSGYQQSLAEQKAMAPKCPAQYADYPALKNGVKCFDDGNELQCLKGDASFWVNGQKVTGQPFRSRPVSLDRPGGAPPGRSNRQSIAKLTTSD
jgi:hypothetical protein